MGKNLKLVTTQDRVSELIVQVNDSQFALSSLLEPREQTVDSYECAMRQFVFYCKANNLPLEVVTIENCLTFFIECIERGLMQNTLKAWRYGINYHLRRLLPESPMDSLTFEQSFGNLLNRFSSGKVNQARALHTKEIIQMVGTRLSDNTFIEKRDKTIILVGFTGGLRIDELAQTKYRPGLDCGNCVEIDTGFILKIPKSKTSSKDVFIPYTGKPVCPATHLKEWLKVIRFGQVFVKISRGIIFGKSLSDRAMREMLKKRAKLAGIRNWERVSGHTLRHSFINTAYRNGATLAEIASQTGQAERTVIRYLMNADFIDKNPALKLF
jgi:site-specific recombinase XerD